MAAAMAAAGGVRWTARPNPWVGCVIRTVDGHTATGATRPVGEAHAEIDALERLRADGGDAAGATVAVTLEPCAHHGRTPPCADALVDAGVARVEIGVLDPDPRVAGRGVERLRAAGIEVEVGVEESAVTTQLAGYLHQRRTGRPLVVAKLAATLDGRTAAPDGSSQWITSEAARIDAHRLRADSDVIVVGAGTVREDDPSLTVRHVDGPDPERFVLGSVPADAAARPCTEWDGSLADLIDELGRRGTLQVLLEGGAGVLGDAQRAGLVDRWVVYLAPALFGGEDALGMFRGPGAPTMAELWRGEFVDVRRIGGDVRIVVESADAHEPSPDPTHRSPDAP